MIAYSSIYGNTELVANILACRLKEAKIPLVMYDTSVIDHSYILAAAFKYSHLVFASPTYNGEVFSTMESLLLDIARHKLKNKRVALIENGTWFATAAKKMREILAPLENIEFLGDALTVKSTIRSSQVKDVERLAELIIGSL